MNGDALVKDLTFAYTTRCCRWVISIGPLLSTHVCSA